MGGEYGDCGVLMCCGEEASKQAGIISLCRSLALLHCSTFHQMPPDATLLWGREDGQHTMQWNICNALKQQVFLFFSEKTRVII